MADHITPNEDEFIKSLENGKVGAYGSKSQAHTSKALLQFKGELEMDVIRLFFEEYKYGDYTDFHSRVSVSDAEVQAYILNHDMEKAFVLMRAWANMRNNGMFVLAPLEGGESDFLGEVSIENPELRWKISV